MASGIRGITVEINGNTKKLIDALKETGKETKDIKAELAQVDRLLKLDPSNTELLAQRQEWEGGRLRLRNGGGCG